jgi:hypothetical protein
MKIDVKIDIKGTTAFKYLGTFFTYLRKCKEEVLNRNGQATKVTGTLNSLF